jgi:phosphopantothenoylcysteine decarboxylase / phosphopantothenate---cysteine ligase
VANDVGVAGTMGGDENAVALVTAGGIERWERMAKAEVARRLAQRIAQEFA